MPPVNVPTPGGKTITVDLPEGMDFKTPEGRAEAIRLAKRQISPPPALPTQPQPDAVGRARAALTKEPPAGTNTAVSRALFGETVGSWDAPGRYARAAGEMFLPGSYGDLARDVATLPIGGSVLTAPLKRIGVGGLAGGIADTASKGYTGVTDFAKNVGKHGLVQGLGEILPGALRFGVAQREGKRLLKPYDEATAARPKMEEARIEGDKARVTEARAADEMQGQRIRQGHAAIKETLESKAARENERIAAGNESRRAAAKEQHAGDVAGVKEGTARINARIEAENATRAARAKEQHAGDVTRMKEGHAALESARERGHAGAVESAKAAHAAETKAWEDTGAKSIMAAFKQAQPAWRSLPDGERGLLEAVSASGQAKMSAAFDTAMKQIAREAHGVQVDIPVRDAAALGLKGKRIQAKDPAERDTMRVYADQLAEAATGFWKKDHGIYRRAVGALDKAGIGDPEARAQYRAGVALIQFADKSGMLRKGKGTTAVEGFNPEAARAGFTKLKTLDELRRRGMGDMFTGAIAEAVRRERPALRLPSEPAPLGPVRLPPFRAPQEIPALSAPRLPPFRAPQETPSVSPPSLARPLVPPFRAPKSSPETPAPTKPEGVTTRTTPTVTGLQGAAALEIPSILAGYLTGNWKHASWPWAVGALAGPAMGGRRIVTGVPRESMTPFGRLATDVTESARAVTPQEVEEDARRRKVMQ